ncbi:DUF2971 domain-containing protein [Priestia megaterium]|uniref:DUF2971 domain-containing protein n=1 Tax=Priestia megaterium TaxID=1404 RepID=UPI001374ADDF|nr:DUF2971 domain-containing protein [Priestia megaterium]
MGEKERDWKEEFAEKIFTIGATKEDEDAALKLKRDNIPQSLYKYRAVHEFSIKNFADDQIWFNSSARMNDPYDSSLSVNSELFIEEFLKVRQVDEYLDKQLEKHRKRNLSPEDFKKVEDDYRNSIIKLKEQLNEEFKERIAHLPSRIRKTTHISCFSEKNDSILMWSHYTNNHEGFCLEYDFAEYAKVNAKLLEALNPIIYDDEIFDVSYYLLKMYQNDSSTIDTKMIRNAVVRKAKAWSYEEEWRILRLFEPQDTGYEIGTFKPKSIYLGAKISEKNKATLIELAKEKKVNVYQMKLKSNEFKLEVHPEYIVSEELTK